MKTEQYKILSNEAINLLKQLIKTPSVSGEEERVAQLASDFLSVHSIKVQQKHNNVWAFNKEYNPAKPTLMLNSHLDTVKPNAGWTKDPFAATVEDGKFFGLGSNDAGASLVSLLSVFIHFFQRSDLNHNLIFLASAEEETSGKNGIQSVLPELDGIDLAIVGEPTGMQMAVAEKGLIVLRCQAQGQSGHAARNRGVNAITNAIKDIKWFHSYQFPNESAALGPVNMSVTMINAGTQHNVIPATCDFTVDIRTTDTSNNKEVLRVIREQTSSIFSIPSLNLNPSSIPDTHQMVKVAREMDIKTFGSPTLSDQTYISSPSIKMGPGMSERSHTADEFVYLSEIEEGIAIYIELLERFLTEEQK